MRFVMCAALVALAGPAVAADASAWRSQEICDGVEVRFPGPPGASSERSSTGWKYDRGGIRYGAVCTPSTVVTGTDRELDAILEAVHDPRTIRRSEWRHIPPPLGVTWAREVRFIKGARLTDFRVYVLPDRVALVFTERSAGMVIAPEDAPVPEDVAKFLSSLVVVGAGGSPAVVSTTTPSTNVLGLLRSPIDKSDPDWRSSISAPRPLAASFDPAKEYFATVATTKGSFTFKLLPDKAPRHVTNFVHLAEIGFYEGSPFHRVCAGFMMQGGDPTGTGTGGAPYKVAAEFNDVRHVRGVLSMARAADPGSATSQFFVMFTDSPHLDRQYTAFGEMVEGEQTLAAFERDVAVAAGSGTCRPAKLETIRSVTIEARRK